MLNTLLWNLLVTTGLAVLLAVLCRMSMLRTRPALRHWLWLLLLAKLLVPPLVGVPLLPAVANHADTDATPSPMVVTDGPPEWTVVHDEQVHRIDSDMRSSQAGPEAAKTPSLESSDRTRAIVLGGLLAVSLAGTCVLLLIHGSHAVKLVRWLRRAGTEDSLLAASCAEVALRLNIRGGVRSCVVDTRTTPMLLGWCRPLVVMPRRLLDDLSPEQLQNILAHELAHLVRRDHWANGFVFVVKSLFWWNPVVWWADRELHAAQELCCDWIAIDCCSAGRRSYATTLLKALDFIQADSLPLPSQALGMGSRETILRRFEMIGETDLSYRLSRGMALMLFLLAALLICIPVRGRAETPAASVAKADEGVKEKTVTTEPEEAKPQRETTGTPKVTLESLGFSGASCGPGADEELDTLIKEKKYELVKAFDAKGEKRYEYRFTYSDGRQVNRKFTMPLDEVSSWADYQKKQELQREQRNERISQALTSGRFRLSNLEVMQHHICRDVASGNTFKVQRIQRPDQSEIALPRADFGAIPPGVQETSWKEHLQAIRDGKRLLLNLETLNSYTYEMTADDGAKEFFSYGGPEPLEAIVKRSASPVSFSRAITSTTSSVPAKPGTPEEVHGVRPKGKCSLSGTLVSASTGKPIAGARMYLFYNVTHAAIFVNTNSDGAFVFKDIPKGPYSLRSSHMAGYRDAVYDPEGNSGKFPPFTLEDGEQRLGIVLKAEEACRVAGEIRDEYGNVPSDTQAMLVFAWFKADGSDKHSLEQGFVKADGSYVIDGLGNRPVYVMATNWRTQEQGEGYPAIYAPSTFFRGEARLVTFDQSRNVDGVNITLRATGGLVLAGTVRDEKGDPVPEALVVVHHRDMLFDRVTTYSDAQGHYELQGLGDGEVLVHVDAMHRGFVRTRAPIALEAKAPKVRRDFILHRGVSISGKLVGQDGNPWQIAGSHGGAVIIKDSMGPEGKPSWSGLPNKYGVKGVRENSAVFYNPGEGDYDRGEMLFPTRSTFVFPSLKPGHTLLSFSPQVEGKKVLQILHNGQDILKFGLTTKPGEEVKDITIVVGAEPAMGAALPSNTPDAAISPASDVRSAGRQR